MPRLGMGAFQQGTADDSIAAPFVPPTFSGNLLEFGDSFTVGQGATPGFGYGDKLGVLRGLSIVNRAVGGSMVVDTVKTMMNAGDTITASQLISFSSLYNDHRFLGPSNEAALTAHCNVSLSCMAHLATTSASKVSGVAATKVGTWSTNTPYPGTAFSSTLGDTLSANVSGSVVYISIVISRDFGKLINVKVDGVDKGNYSPIYPSLTPNSAAETFATGLIRIGGLSTGAHTVLVTLGANAPGSTSFNTFINWVGGNAGTGPTVMVTTVADMLLAQRSLNSPYNLSTVSGWNDVNSLLMSMSAYLRGDGLNVHSTRWDTALNTSTDLSADSIHPNDAGHLKLATLVSNDAVAPYPNLSYPSGGQIARFTIAAS
jgi:hypothetical protein